jgi:two-component system nitrate/nitrite response regulator NarL
VTSAGRTTVFLAEDHPLYLAGLADTIRRRPELELVGTSEDGREALAGIVRLQPEVAVLDVRMPGLDGPAVMNAIQRENLPTAVLFLSAHVESGLVYDALASGASGYLSKLTEGGRVCEAIEALGRGETVLPPEIQPGLLDEMRRRRIGDRPLLTSREREVLRLLADGLTVPRIAEELHLGQATIRTHLQNLYEKLEVSTQAAAVAAAMRLGLLE